MFSVTVLSVVVAAELLAVLPGVAWAQTTDVTCQLQWASLDNSLGQNPCLVSAFLMQPCSRINVTVHAITTGQTYDAIPDVGPICLCSTVSYSAISACAMCQGGSWPSWSTWANNCVETFNQRYSFANIPAGTSVPPWAFLDVETNDEFNPLAVEKAISSSGLTDPSTTSIPTTIPRPTIPITHSSSPTSPSTSSIYSYPPLIPFIPPFPSSPTPVSTPSSIAFTATSTTSIYSMSAATNGSNASGTTKSDPAHAVVVLITIIAVLVAGTALMFTTIFLRRRNRRNIRPPSFYVGARTERPATLVPFNPGVSRPPTPISKDSPPSYWSVYMQDAQAADSPKDP